MLAENNLHQSFEDWLLLTKLGPVSQYSLAATRNHLKLKTGWELQLASEAVIERFQN